MIMKKLNQILLILTLFIVPCQAYPPPFTTVLYSNALTGLFINSGDQVQFTFAGTNYFTNGPTTLYINSDEDSTNLATFSSGPNMAWTITGSLIPDGTNLQVSIQYADDTNSLVSSFVMTNFDSYTNTLWFSCSAFDSLPEITLTETNMTGPNILEWYPFGLGVSLSNSLAQLAASTITNGGLMNFDTGLILSDGSGNITASSYFGSLKDSSYSTGPATYVATANGDGTWTWSPASGGVGVAMNFDGGVIFSDGSGDIFTTGMYENTNVDGQFNIGGNNTATVNLSTYNGSATCQLNFYTFSFYGNQNGAGFESDTPACTFTFADQGNFCGLAEFNLNAGGNSTAGQITLVGIGSGGYDQSSGFGGMAVGADWSHGGFSMPDNGLIVEGNSGFCQQYPAYPVDAGGDINFTGDLRMNGTPIILPDSSGNGGTTLMLQAQDNGTPMYLHVQSDGSSAWTSSP